MKISERIIKTDNELSNKEIKIMKEKELIVKKLNDIIDQAVCHGADAGGSYYQNEKELVKSINSILKTLKLYADYEVIVDNRFNINNWSNIKIVKKTKIKGEK